MKKMIAFFLTVALLMGVWSLAGQADSLAREKYIIAQLKEDPDVQEIWLPVLPEGFSLKDVTITSNGSYSYTVTDASSDTSSFLVRKISLFTDRQAQGRGDLVSVYYGLLQEGQAMDPFAVTGENAASLVLPAGMRLWDDYERSYACDVYSQESGEYRNRPAVALQFLFATIYSMDIMAGYTGQEVTVSLSDTTNASVFVDYKKTVPTGSTLAWFEESFPVGFTTFGDADLDGNVDAADALAILRHSVGKQPITDQLALLMADGDDNGVLVAADALICLKKAVGK